MKKKWIYIEPLVFIWHDEDYYLFYNSLNGKKALIPKSDTYNSIIQSLQNVNNLYCTKIEEDIVDKKDFIDFIATLTTNQLGNIVECKDSERPINTPPKLIMSKSVENSKKKNTDYYDPKILDNINELTIQVSGYCSFNCKNCKEYKFQLFHCEKTDFALSEDRIENLILQVRHLNLQKVNIVGGNILALENFEHLVHILDSLKVLKIYNIHYKQIKFERILHIIKDEFSIIRMIIHFNNNEKEIISQINNFDNYNSRILWSFVVSSEDELELCYSILEKCGSIQHEIKPFYNKQNEKFIREFVFIDNEDIQGFNLNKKQIFANQIINKNYFGNISIQANGDVYDNLNFSAVGTIDDCLEDIVHKIINEGRSWRLIRCNDICNSCLYKFLCPSPSNLEIVMNSKTICQKPRSYDQPNKLIPHTSF